MIVKLVLTSITENIGASIAPKCRYTYLTALEAKSLSELLLSINVPETFLTSTQNVFRNENCAGVEGAEIVASTPSCCNTLHCACVCFFFFFFIQAVVTKLKSDVDGAIKAIRNKELVPLPGEVAEQVAQSLGQATKQMGAVLAQLITAAAEVSPPTSA